MCTMNVHCADVRAHFCVPSYFVFMSLTWILLRVYHFFLSPRPLTVTQSFICKSTDKLAELNLYNRSKAACLRACLCVLTSLAQIITTARRDL